MEQKVIQVGNSLAVTIPRAFVKDAGLKAGQKVLVSEDLESEILTIQPATQNALKGGLSPEFLRWLKKFNAKYKKALAELAKK